MDELRELGPEFFQPMILIMALVLVLSLIGRRRDHPTARWYLMGAALGAAVIYAPYVAVDLGSAGSFEIATLLLGCGTALMGMRVGGIALVTSGTVAWTLSDPGNLTGILSLILAFAIGALWQQAAPRFTWPHWAQGITLAAVMTSQGLFGIMTLSETPVDLLGLTVPIALLCDFIGALTMHALIRHEIAFLTTTNVLQKVAATDHLTGLANRRSLESQFSDLSAKSRHGGGMTALYFDIDRFKDINDTHGHAAGDAVLQAVARRLSATFRAEDVFSRLGGDEFFVMMPDLTVEDAARVAERCRQLVARTPVHSDDGRINATISVGAVWTRDPQSLNRLLREADAALYAAKQSGRNAVKFEPLKVQNATLVKEQAA